VLCTGPLTRLWCRPSISGLGTVPKARRLEGLAPCRQLPVESGHLAKAPLSLLCTSQLVNWALLQLEKYLTYLCIQNLAWGLTHR
jgi:hypothetical protein